MSSETHESPGAEERAAGPRRTSRGVLVTVVLQWCRYLTTVVALILLARLLTPRDYGLVAEAAAITGLAAVVGDLGLSLAALQAPSLTQRQKTGLFWVNAAVGVLVAGIVAALAHPLAAFYGEPRVVEVTLGLSLVFAINGFAVQLKVEINRALRFTALGVTDLASQAVALGSAVAAALLGAGFWALVIQQLAYATVGLLLAAALAGWRPSAPWRSGGIGDLLRFGRDTFAVQVANYITSTVDAVVIGRLFGAAVLGLYNRAFQLVLLPLNQVLSPLTRVFLPRLAAVADDREFNDVLVRLQRVVAYVIAGPLSLAACIATPLLSVVLGPRWAAAGSLMQLLLVGAVFQALGYLYYWAFLARRSTRDLFVSELWGRVPMVVLFVTLGRLGPEFVALSVAIGQALIWAAGTFRYGARAGVRTAQVLAVCRRPLVVWVLAAICGKTVDALVPDALPAIVRLGVLALAWVVVPGAAYASTRVIRDDVGAVVREVLPARLRPRAA